MNATPHLLSASRVELARKCVAWLAPDAVWDERSTYAQRVGTAVHWCIEQKLSGSRLGMHRIVSDAGDTFNLTARQCDKVQEHTDAWEEWAAFRPWLIESIVDVEVPYAYDPETRTARRLERGEHREYKGAKEHEIVGTIDALAELGGHHVVIDWKCGGFGLPTPDAHEQTRTNSAIVSTAHGYRGGLSGVTGMLVALRPGDSWHDSHEFRVHELLAVDEGLREIHERRKLPVAPTPGAHCDKCPAIRTCKATNKGKRKKL